MHAPTATLRGPEGIEERVVADLEGYRVSTHLRCGHHVGDRRLEGRPELDLHVQLRTDAGWVPAATPQTLRSALAKIA